MRGLEGRLAEAGPERPVHERADVRPGQRAAISARLFLTALRTSEPAWGGVWLDWLQYAAVRAGVTSRRAQRLRPVSFRACPTSADLEAAEGRDCRPSPWSATRAADAPENGMRAPINERQALERERAELPGQIAPALAALAATPLSHKARRERLMWQIRRDQKRMAEVEARLAGR